MDWIGFFVIGFLAALAVGAVVAIYLGRRGFASAMRARQRRRDREHLMQLALLTGGLAHEIKNPLSTIKLNLELLAEDFEHSDDELHRRNFARLQGLQNEVQRLQDILADFLKYADGHEAQPAQVDLRKLVGEVIDFFRPQAEDSRVVLRPTMPEEPVFCRVDRPMIKQALLNLMLNATQAMAGGGELMLRLTPEGKDAVLEIIDTGPGIAPELREKIFDPYYSGRSGGLGLGLPTTRRMIQQNDGEIRVDGEPGKGTRFIITFRGVQK